MAGFAGMGGGDSDEIGSFPSLGAAPAGSSRKKLKKKRKKKRH